MSGLAKMDDAWRTLQARAEKAEAELGDVRAMMQSLKCVKCHEALAALESIARLPLTRSVEMHAAQIARAALEGEKR